MTPEEYRAVLGAPDADKNTVVVEAKREFLPVEIRRARSAGPLLRPFWALAHPLKSWRIFLP